MRQERIDQIEARVNAATEGPWEASCLYDVTDKTYIEECEFGFIGMTQIEVERAGIEYSQWRYFDFESPQQKQIHADAEFIAHAREDVPFLLNEIKRLNKMIDITRNTLNSIELGVLYQQWDELAK